MAIKIKSIPVLEGKSAKKFNDLAKKNYDSKRHTIDFTEEKKIARKILQKELYGDNTNK